MSTDTLTRPATIAPAPSTSRVRAIVDVGSSKFGCWIVKPRRDGVCDLRGKGYLGSQGIKRGEIVDADDLEVCLADVIQEAEHAAGEELRSVIVATSGGRPASSHMRVSVPLFGRAVDRSDLDRAMEVARRRFALPGRVIVHVTALEVAIDGGRPLRDPCGMRGDQLDMLVHIVSMETRHIEDLRTCLDGCHLDVAGVVAGAYSAAWAVTTPEERERGVIVLDLGGGVSTAAHFFGGRLALIVSVPGGGEHVTADLAQGLSTTHAHAERLKTLYTSIQPRHGDADQRIAVPLIGDASEWPTGEVARSRLTEFARPRVVEILHVLQDEMARYAGLFQAMPPASIVLTGGASRIEGLAELVDDVFELPVRFGRPARIASGESFECEPCSAAASGALALFVGEDGGQGWRGEPGGSPLGRGISRLRRWISENF